MKTSRFLTAALVAAAALASAVPSRAQRSAADEAENEWTPTPAPLPGPGGPDESETAEGGFSKPDNETFGENLQDKILSQLCSHIHVRAGVDILSSENFVIQARPDRYFKKYADGSWAIIDEHGLYGAMMKSWLKDLGDSGFKFGVFGGLESDNRSVVTRPLGKKPECSDLKRLFDPRDAKLAFPLSTDVFNEKGDAKLAERIKAMQEGEIWKLMLRLGLTWGAGFQQGELKEDDASFMITFSDSRSKSGAATMSLRRLPKNKIRFRFRADHVNVRSKTLGLNLNISSLQQAAEAGSVISKAFKRRQATEINNLLRAWFTLATSDSDGERVVFEFVLDLDKPGDAELMAETLRGNFLKLVGLGAEMAIPGRADEGRVRQVYDEFLASVADKTARKATWAAGDDYKSRSVRGWPIRRYNLLAFSGEMAQSLTENRIDRRDDSSEEFRYFCGEQSAQFDSFRVPLVGPLVRTKSDRKNCAVVRNRDKRDPQPEDPFMAYIHNEGFEGLFGVPSTAIKGALDEYNDVLRLAGAQRGARGGRVTLDGSFIPAPRYQGEAELSERTGTLGLTLVFNQQAVRDGFSVSGMQLLKAMPAVVEPTLKPVAEWLAANGWTDKSTVLFNEHQARRDMADLSMPGDASAYEMLTELSRTASFILADFARVGAAADPVERARRISELVGGDSKSGWEYDRMLSLVIQFVDPNDLTAKFNGSVKTTRASWGAKKESGEARLDLKKGRAEVPGLKEAGAARERFSEPSVLRD